MYQISGLPRRWACLKSWVDDVDIDEKWPCALDVQQLESGASVYVLETL